MSGKIVVAGALGLVGGALIEHLERLGDWEIIGLSRRIPTAAGKHTRHISVDLTDRSACQAKLAAIGDVTHLVYCALFEKPDLVKGWLDTGQMAVNETMLVNFLDAFEPHNTQLRHVTVLQGTKAYGLHLGPMKIPGREADPRHIHPNFYWLQEDRLKSRQQGKSWHWTIFRPQTVIGFAVGTPMNLLSAIGVYASISRELGLPLVFPGIGQPTPTEITDVRLQAKAIEWAGRTPAARNQTFNITNGDTLVWEHLWPEIARHFRLEVGVRHPMSLAAVMPGKERLWKTIQAKYALAPYGYEELVGRSWQFADLVLSGGAPSLVSTISIRKAGFHDCIDSATMMSELFSDLEARKIIPDPRTA